MVDVTDFPAYAIRSVKSHEEDDALTTDNASVESENKEEAEKVIKEEGGVNVTEFVESEHHNRGL